MARQVIEGTRAARVSTTPGHCHVLPLNHKKRLGLGNRSGKNQRRTESTSRTGSAQIVARIIFSYHAGCDAAFILL